MSEGISRRGFMKASATATGFAIAAGRAPFAYAANEKVKIGCIGTGGQGNFHLVYGLMPAKNLEVTAICDVFNRNRAIGMRNAKAGERQVKEYRDYREMIEKEDLDGVVIATPLYTHFQIAMDCLDAGLNVFLEKTICKEIEQCVALAKKVHETGKVFQCGHQRRYNPRYNKAVWLAREKGILGRLNHVTAQWHRNNDWRRPIPKNYTLDEQEKKWIHDLEHWLNWRLYAKSSCGLMTELATHQIDVANWFLDAVPTRVYGMGGIDYWRDGREVWDHVALVYEYDITPESASFTVLQPRNDKQKRSELVKPYKVYLTYTSICANAKLGASELMQGDRSAIMTTEPTSTGCKVFMEPALLPKGKEAVKKAQEDKTGTGTRLLSNSEITQGAPIRTVEDDRQVDNIQMESFANDIMTGGTPKANIMVGLRTAICGLAGFQAIKENKVVEIKPEWYNFDFETPNPSMYDFVEEPAEEKKPEKKKA